MPTLHTASVVRKYDILLFIIEVCIVVILSVGDVQDNKYAVIHE